jgi:hypothetical protein
MARLTANERFTNNTASPRDAFGAEKIGEDGDTCGREIF